MKMSKLLFYTKLTMCSLISVLILSTSTLANTYYVDKNHPNAEDSNPGTEASPWLTITKAKNTMVADDTVTVNAGTYPERVTITTSGSSGNLITYRASGTVITQGFQVQADYIKIDGFTATRQTGCSSPSSGAGIYISGDNGIITNNHLYQNYRNGIRTTNSSDNFIIQYNLAEGNGLSGMTIAGNNHQVLYNEIRETVQNIGSCNQVDADGMRVFGSGHTIGSNYLHSIFFDGSTVVNAHLDCFQTWNDTYNFDESVNNSIFEYNKCDFLDGHTQFPNTGQGIVGFQSSGPTDEIIIRYNIFRSYVGMDVLAGSATNVKVVHNDFINDENADYDYEFGLAVNGISTWTIKNNIFYNQPRAVYHTDGSATAGSVGNNLAYGHDGAPLNDGQEDGPFTDDFWQTDPKFADPANNDFHLLPNSPSINAADNTVCASHNDALNPNFTDWSKVTDGTIPSTLEQGDDCEIGAYVSTLGSPPSPPTNLTIKGQ